MNFDASKINNHEPTESDIAITLYDTGQHMVKIINLPFDYEEEVADSLSLSEARKVKKVMLTGKTYVDMCRLARLELEKIQGPPRQLTDRDGNII